jgi:hypothetical protein
MMKNKIKPLHDFLKVTLPEPSHPGTTYKITNVEKDMTIFFNGKDWPLKAGDTFSTEDGGVYINEVPISK